jgi:DNA-binding MarR family transcriptional regulator
MDGAPRYLKLSVTEQQLRLGSLVQSLFERASREVGLGAREARVLMYVGKAHVLKEGAISLEISRESGIAASHVSQAIAQLHRRGLVIIPEVRSAADRRVKRLYLATKGKQVLVSLESIAGGIEAQLRAGMRVQARRSRNLDRAADLLLLDSEMRQGRRR